MNHAPHVTRETIAKVGGSLPQFARSRKPMRRMYAVNSHASFHHPLPNYNMWRGNHGKYKYTNTSLSHFGEGNAVGQYHQHYKHAKCDTDYGKGGREFEYLSVKRGKLVQKPLPTVQYADPKSKPVWLFKSWHGSLGNSEVWQREVQYPEHIPEHLDAKRPLAVLAPRTLHKVIHNVHMERITVTICPFHFGFGPSVQQAVMDFYRRVLSIRSPFQNDRVFLYYTTELISPRIEVTWLDGSVYEPPILEGCTARDLTQMVMEQAWLAADRLGATGKALQPLAIDDYKWHQNAIAKTKKKAAATGKK